MFADQQRVDSASIEIGDGKVGALGELALQRLAPVCRHRVHEDSIDSILSKYWIDQKLPWHKAAQVDSSKRVRESSGQ